MSLQFGKVPHPEYIDRPILKPEGYGWDDLGQRTVKGVVLHRMLGYLWPTDTYFRMPGVNALTDYGVGTAGSDGAANDGVILRWNDPLGRRAGWASGPLSAPYGDGLAFYNKYGINAINRDQVSIEISGKNYTDPVSPVAWEEIAKLVAYWADQYHIPHDKFPIAPQDGFSFVRWHQEYTIGTSKVCPGKTVMDGTNALITRVQQILKQYQEIPTVETPTPTLKYVAPGPVPELDGKDVNFGGVTWFACHRKVRVRAAELKCLQYAMDGALETREPLTQGEWVTVEWAVRAKNGKWYWVTERGTRLEMAGTTPKTNFIV